MPRRLTQAALVPYLVSTGSLGGVKLDQGRISETERALAEVFDVNPIVARIRIADLYPLAEAGQLML
jgi:hypothetical protein